MDFLLQVYNFFTNNIQGNKISSLIFVIFYSLKANSWQYCKKQKLTETPHAFCGLHHGVVVG